MSENNITDPGKASAIQDTYTDKRKPASVGVRFVASLWQLLGLTLIITGVLGMLAIYLSHVSLKDELGDLFSPITRAVFAVLFPIVTGVGVICFNRGRRMKARSAQDLVSADPRPPVLYLRSFKDDPAGANTNRMSEYLTQFPFLTLFNVETEEEQLAKVMHDIGPLIAIGKPGEKLPELGAARMYVSDDEWQETITALMTKARLVVLRAGDTQGFWWEVQTAVRNLSPEQLLFLIPFDDITDYEEFSQRMREYIPRWLPPYAGSSSTKTSIKGFIYFEPGWTSRFIELKAPLTRTIGYGGELERKLRMSLRPVYEQLNVPWSPKFKWASVGLWVVCSLAALAAVALLSESVAGPRVALKKTPLNERLLKNPEIRKAFEGLPAERAEALVKELSSKGLSRVSDSVLLQRASLLRKILAASESDIFTCSAIMKGSLSEFQAREMFEKLEPSDVETSFFVIEQSILAELREAPSSELSDLQITDAFKELFKRMSKDEADLVIALFSSENKLLVNEACRTARQFYERLITLEEPHRSTLLRATVPRGPA